MCTYLFIYTMYIGTRRYFRHILMTLHGGEEFARQRHAKNCKPPTHNEGGVEIALTFLFRYSRFYSRFFSIVLVVGKSPL